MNHILCLYISPNALPFFVRQHEKCFGLFFTRISQSICVLLLSLSLSNHPRYLREEEIKTSLIFNLRNNERRKKLNLFLFFSKKVFSGPWNFWGMILIKISLSIQRFHWAQSWGGWSGKVFFHVFYDVVQWVTWKSEIFEFIKRFDRKSRRKMSWKRYGSSRLSLIFISRLWKIDLGIWSGREIRYFKPLTLYLLKRSVILGKCSQAFDENLQIFFERSLGVKLFFRSQTFLVSMFSI